MNNIKNEQIKIIADWTARQYKDNKKVVSTSDSAWNSGASERTTIGNANEARRNAVIRTAKVAVELIDGINARFPVYATADEVTEFAETFIAKQKYYPTVYSEIVAAAITEKAEPECTPAHTGEVDASDLFADLI